MRGNIPSFIWITDAKVHDVNILDELIAEPGSIYVMDRAYLDFKRLYQMHQDLAFFILRAKSNTQLRRLYSSSVDRTMGIICDQTVRVTGQNTLKAYPDKLRRIKYQDQKTGRRFTFLTNHFALDCNNQSRLVEMPLASEVILQMD